MISLKAGSPASGKHLTFDESLACRAAWAKHCAKPAVCSPPAENSEAPGASGADDGQGACTLTIDTHCLRNVWLPSYAKSVTAARHLGKLDTAARRRRSPSQPALWHAYWVVSRDVERLVDKILTRGGLLLIGGVL